MQLDCKTVLLVFGIIVAIIGILEIVPYVGYDFGVGTVPIWNAALELILGVVGAGYALMQK